MSHSAGLLDNQILRFSKSGLERLGRLGKLKRCNWCNWQSCGFRSFAWCKIMLTTCQTFKKTTGWFLFRNGRLTNLELQLCFLSIWIEPTRLILGPSPSVRISSGGRNQCTNDWQKGVLANHIYLLNGGLVHKAAYNILQPTTIVWT